MDEGGTSVPTRRRAIAYWTVRLAVAAALLGFVGFSLALAAMPAPALPTPTPGIIVGQPGGAVIQPSPTASRSASETVSPSPSATPLAVPVTPEPTAAPVASAPTPPPAPPAPPAPVVQPVTPPPTPVVVAAIDPPDAAVAAFYHDVVVGDFDAAYALWSARMQATYPREANLDERFDQTADIAFSTLRTVERGATTAVVPANFTETYDSGTSREFIGYWRLVLVDGRWLLDEPHY